MAQEASAPPPPTPLSPSGGRLPTSGSPPRPTPVADTEQEVRRGSADLDRLLGVAVLTPAQATHVAAELLMFASTIGQGRRSDIRVTPPVVTPHGDVDVVPADDPSTGVGIEELLGRLVDNARRLPAHPRAHQVALLRRLEDVAGSSHEPAARALMLRSALDDALGPDAATRITEELAYLVAALAQVADTHHVAVTPVPIRPVPLRAAAPTTARREIGGRRARGPVVRTAAVVLAGLVVLVGGYLAVVRPWSGGGRGDRATGPQPSEPSSKPPSHAARTPQRTLVPVLAPPKAGRVTGVHLQQAGPCQPGAPCPVRVTVDLAPTGVSQAIGWRVGVVQECTRHVTWSALTTVTAQPGWTRVYAGSSVRIPTGHPVALVAVTGTPARAQSPPDRLTSSAPRC